MTRDESRDRDQKQRIVWAPRGQILWPAEVQETVSGAAVCFKYLGPKKERAVAADPSSAVSFIPNLDRLSNQSSDPGFVQALMEGCRLSHIGDKLPTGWHEQKDETSSQETPSLYSDKNSASSEEIDDDGPVALGTRIRIREAQAIHPKLHAYENTEAVVVRLPVLPSTWYCVRLHDDEIVKIRRTAFQVLPDRRSAPASPVANVESLEEAHKDQQELKLKLPQRPSLYRRNAPRDSKMKRKITVDVPEQNAKRRKHQGKSRGAKSNLVGKYVTIECGRYKGERGYVIRGGNGYYCVQLGGRNSGSSNNVMKRSSDLRPIPFPIEGESRAKSARFSASRNDGPSGGHCKNESWVNRRVYVKAGKHQGKMGTIRRSGHGFYCVSIKGIGDVMKRASDLELCDEKKEPTKIQKRTVDSDKSLKFAASMLIDMMTMEPSSESELEEESETEPFHRARMPVPNVPKKPAEISAAAQFAEGLPISELKTPILRASMTDGDIMTWDRPSGQMARPRQAPQMLRSVLLPRAGSESKSETMHSLSTYW
uniref:KOW domain-containing protein n=4 Tax=Lotharella globosa TaxID=91324 RepID=A0A6U3CJA4_9EUKA|mmetsp:Transcript_34855/g.67786  ORF Transcript_34855/g.67786 Transcript_34855/m.67786 type:complete len:540 (-) Transcript_34855:519-2138(-)|eukprot:CAMPEP_0167809084 /NCGR_PEP_ID=MMETSP0111_2-20121227/23585_1 /TAXON_ID=91324 /ORGANISM="Lotharella globosa, Strain CCCM811" /LENGTH=539 /DNA_ID=CAMNT_0007707405 /DNA_START=2009 /DNA_END=3628 /DNA_ORIENTATION=+